MASGPITSWQINGETMEPVTDFIFWAFYFWGFFSFLGRKFMTNLDSILKSRDIANKGLSSQSYGFFSSMYGRES